MDVDTFPTNKNFYAGVIPTVEHNNETQVVLLKHRKNNLFSLPAGTFNIPETLNKAHAKIEECYDNSSVHSLREKAEKTLKKVFKTVFKNYSEEDKKILIDVVMNAYGKQKNHVAFQAAIESIEESGMIPFGLSHFETVEISPRRSGDDMFYQFYFTAEEFYTLNETGELVLIQSIKDLPLHGKQFNCTDNDLDTYNSVILGDSGKATYFIHEEPSEFSLEISDKDFKRNQVDVLENFFMLLAHQKMRA